MKKIFYLPMFLIIALVSCTSQDDIEIPNIKKVYVNENFQGLTHNTDFSKDGWVNFNEQGSKVWRSRTFSGNGYVEFNTFQSGDLLNIGWLITPEFEVEQGTNFKLEFKSAQNFVSNNDNKIQVFISNNFNLNNFGETTWVELQANVANSSTPGYEFVESGNVDLSTYSGGKMRIGFKATGSGTNTNLDGLFQVDDIIIIEN